MIRRTVIHKIQNIRFGTRSNVIRYHKKLPFTPLSTAELLTNYDILHNPIELSRCILNVMQQEQEQEERLKQKNND